MGLVGVGHQREKLLVVVGIEPLAGQALIARLLEACLLELVVEADDEVILPFGYGGLVLVVFGLRR